MLWFEAVGYSGRFWTALLTQAGCAAAGGLAAATLVFLLTWMIPRQPPVARFWPETLAAVGGIVWGLTNWEAILAWWYAVAAGAADPIFGLDLGFYLFSLPFYDALYWLLWWSGMVAAGASLAYLLILQAASSAVSDQIERPEFSQERRRRLSAGAVCPLYLALGGLALVIAGGNVLAGFHLLSSQRGTVTGAGWTDVHIRIPAYYLVAGVTVLAGCVPLAVAASGRLHRWISRGGIATVRDFVTVLGGPAGVVVAVYILALGVAPALTQWLWVSPNEITVERPYIEYNIAHTRDAFGLADIEEQPYPVDEQLSQQTISRNQRVLSEVRLWDPRALLETYEQFQEIRLYYEFNDVDIDRYTIGGRYRQAMISAREMESSNLPRQSQTFVNRYFKYTHGYGLTLAPVSDFTPQGLPNLLVKDLPPKVAYPELAVDRPEIYYGERTDHYVVANSEEAEFDYPRGDKNVYVRYQGSGGVPLTNFWRKLVYGWKFGGTQFLVSGYPTAQSRIMFRRQIEERLSTLAPFLTFDTDPYVVLHEGRMYWFVDAYTTSSSYPYSEQLQGRGAAHLLDGVSYVRNSVKAVVDAYNGDVSLYVFEPDDPIVRVWQRIFPDLLKPREEMPAGLARHVRYPEGLLTAQGLVYSKYHMTDPAVFYNQEDLWVRATEKYYANVQPVEPYYVMWEPPDSEDVQFVLMQPFTPKNRQVLIGWMAGMCDGDNYGRLLAYRFPKEKRVLGTQQVETKIDQDRYLSGQLTLWDQRGSKVIRGNLLVIPLNGTLLYVEPIYLQAEAAAYPELRLVAVMHNDRLSYAETFDEALQGLFEGKQPPPTTPTPSAPPGDRTVQQLVDRANQAFEKYLNLMGEQKFDEAADQLETLQSVLAQLKALSGTPASDAESNKPSRGASKLGP
jgi:uncharacterized membrane protein (UPF0182 family)